DSWLIPSHHLPNSGGEGHTRLPRGRIQPPELPEKRGGDTASVTVSRTAKKSGGSSKEASGGGMTAASSDATAVAGVGPGPASDSGIIPHAQPGGEDSWLIPSHHLPNSGGEGHTRLP